LQALESELKQTPDNRPANLRGLQEFEEAVYYRFFYELTHRFGPLDVLELGTYCGTGAANFASNTSTNVTTVDVSTRMYAWASGVLESLKNVRMVRAHSIENADLFKNEVFDVIFVDSNHIFDSAYQEYEIYRKKVKPNGVMFFDDIHYPPVFPEMDVFWEHVLDEKLEMNSLHGPSGFGAVKINQKLSVPSWKDVRDHAAYEIQNRRFRAGKT